MTEDHWEQRWRFEVVASHLLESLSPDQCNMFKKTPCSWLIPGKSNRRLKQYVQYSDFSGCFPRSLSQSLQSEHGNTQHTPDVWKQLRTENLLEECCFSKRLRVQQTGTWGSKKLRTPEKKKTGKFLYLVMYTYDFKEDTYTGKVWEAPKISGQADWWGSSIGWAQSMKTEQGGCFFLMNRQQHKA